MITAVLPAMLGENSASQRCRCWLAMIAGMLIFEWLDRRPKATPAGSAEA